MRINALPKPPEFLLHTGDLTHLTEPAEFDTLAQLSRVITDRAAAAVEAPAPNAPKEPPVESPTEPFDARTRVIGGSIPADPEPVWHQFAELPKVSAVVTEFQGHARTCPGCGHVTRESIPAAIRAQAFGPRLAAVLSYQRLPTSSLSFPTSRPWCPSVL